MKERICYLETTSRGAAPRAVRLTGLHADDRLELGAAPNAELVSEHIDDAAHWIRERLKDSSATSKRLSTLCLDADGSVCAWVRADEAEPGMIQNAIDEIGAAVDPDALESHNTSTLGERFPALPLELDFQALSDEHTSGGARRAVLGAPDVPAKLLIDRLDAMGIRIDRVESVWHMIARAWDPGSPHRSSRRDSENVLDAMDNVCACVLCDDERGRVLWTWSRAGTLIACGSMRLDPSAETPINDAMLGRLATDWLGWGAQLGVSPTRVVCVHADAVLDTTLGSRLSKHWPSATIDVVSDADPVLTTLRTNVGLESVDQIEALATRPGRAHRSMYRWAAAGLLAGAVVLGVAAWSLFGRASEIEQRTQTIAAEEFETLMALDPLIAEDRLPLVPLRARVNQLRNQAGPVDLTPVKPILDELETVSFILGMPGIEIQSIDFSLGLVKVQIQVEALETAEQINEALRSIEGSSLEWFASPDLKNRGNKIQATYNATWDTGSAT